MPVAKGGPPPLRQVVLVGLGVVMTLGTLLFLVTTTGDLLGGRSPIGIDSGDPIFRPGKATEIAGFIETNDKPFALLDPAGGDRDIWLNHLGDDNDTGWYAFGVRPLAAARSCTTQWDQAAQQFVDSCDGAIYPPTGEGLPQFPVTVGSDGELSIRLDSITSTDGTTTDTNAGDGTD